MAEPLDHVETPRAPQSADSAGPAGIPEAPQVPRPAVSVVIPTFRRARVLEQNVERIREVLLRASCPVDAPIEPPSESPGVSPSAPPCTLPCTLPNAQSGASFEIILVDDHSPDGTFPIIRRLAARYPEVRGIRLAGNAGQQNATLAGLRLASGDTVVTMDDDLKDKPEDVPRLLEALRPGLDVVYGVPERPPSVSGGRRLGTLLKERLIARLCRKPEGLRLTGFRALNRRTADRICQETRRWVYISATIFQEPVRAGQLTVQADSSTVGDGQLFAPANPLTLRAGQLIVQDSRSQATVSGYTWVRLAQVFLRLAVEYGESPLLRLFRKPGRQYEIAEVV